MAIHFDSVAAVRAVRAYNNGTYRGRSNIEVDQLAFERFSDGLPSDHVALVDAIRLVGEDYGGAQRRFLPHGYREEAALIVARLEPVREAWNAAARTAASLDVAVPSEPTLTDLLAPFTGTNQWPVWASKTLHFTRPQAFPVLDSRAKRALGLPSLGSSARDYHRFCAACRETLLGNADAMVAARAEDEGQSPSDLKLLDKILFELGE